MTVVLTRTGHLSEPPRGLLTQNGEREQAQGMRGEEMQPGAVMTIAFPPRYEGTPVTVILIGKTRALVELPNGSQTWITSLDLNRRARKPEAA